MAQISAHTLPPSYTYEWSGTAFQEIQASGQTIYLLAAAVLFYGTPRFRVPGEPTVVALAAVGAAVVAARRWPALTPVVSFAATERRDARPTTPSVSAPVGV